MNDIFSVLIPIGGVIAVLAVLVIIAKSMYKVADIDKALIITGGKKPKIIVSGGAFVIPIIRKASTFDLCMLTVSADKDEIMTSTAVPIIADWTAQIRPDVKDPEKLKIAIISFKERGNDGIKQDVKLTLMGAVRDVVASMTPEQILKDKETFKVAVQESVADEMANMGLELVSLNIQDVTDSKKYFENIAALDSADKQQAADIKKAEVDRATRQKQAEAMKEAEIAEAKAKQESSIAQMDAEQVQNDKRKETDLRIAQNQVETDTAKANAEVAKELQTTIRQKEVEERKGAVEIVKQEQANLAAQKEREVAITRAETEKETKRIDAESTANVENIQAQTRVKVAESDAEAMKKSAEAGAEKIRIEGKAEADVTKAKAEAEAEGIKAKKLAEAEGIKAAMIAQAEGEKALADARASNDKVNFEIEKLKIQTEAQIKIATAQAEVMANIGQNAEFINIGGGSVQGLGSAGGTGNVLIDTLSQLPGLLKILNAENQALNGRNLTEDVADMSKAIGAGLSNLGKKDETE